MMTSYSICDRIWEFVHSSHNQFKSFERSIKTAGNGIRFEAFRGDLGIVVLQSLKVSHLSVIPNWFYESSKSKNWMCELRTFPKSGHICFMNVSVVTKNGTALQHVLVFVLT